MADNQHKDPLESFFKKKAGEYNIQYKEDDWQKLEGRLDAVDKQHAARKRRWIAAAAILFLFSILGYITYEQQQKINQLNERLTNSETITNPAPSQPTSPDLASNQEDSVGELSSSPEKAAETPEPDVVANQPSGQPTATPKANNAEANLATNEITENESRYDFLSETNLVAISAKDSPGFGGRSPAISAIKPPKFNTNIAAIESPRANSSATTPTRSPSSQRTFSRFTVGMLAGPDLSTVGGFSNFHNPGSKLGLMVEYNISQNLSISVGAIRSDVRYEAAGNEYNPPQGYWSYGTVPDQTVGRCILIDIPISLKYNFLHFEHSRLYASAGLSSYIMLDEDYQFNYDYNRPELKQRWHERTGTRHWMSNATLSVGYELDIMRNVSLRAEPFLKVPLQEVGWANVKLYSMGTLVSLNYHIR